MSQLQGDLEDVVVLQVIERHPGRADAAALQLQQAQLEVGNPAGLGTHLQGRGRGVRVLQGQSAGHGNPGPDAGQPDGGQLGIDLCQQVAPAGVLIGQARGQRHRRVVGTIVQRDLEAGLTAQPPVRRQGVARSLHHDTGKQRDETVQTVKGEVLLRREQRREHLGHESLAEVQRVPDRGVDEGHPGLQQLGGSQLAQESRDVLDHADQVAGTEIGQGLHLVGQRSLEADLEAARLRRIARVDQRRIAQVRAGDVRQQRQAQRRQRFGLLHIEPGGTVQRREVGVGDAAATSAVRKPEIKIQVQVEVQAAVRDGGRHQAKIGDAVHIVHERVDDRLELVDREEQPLLQRHAGLQIHPEAEVHGERDLEIGGRLHADTARLEAQRLVRHRLGAAEADVDDQFVQARCIEVERGLRLRAFAGDLPCRGRGLVHRDGETRGRLEHEDQSVEDRLDDVGAGADHLFAGGADAEGVEDVVQRIVEARAERRSEALQVDQLGGRLAEKGDLPVVDRVAGAFVHLRRQHPFQCVEQEPEGLGRLRF